MGNTEQKVEKGTANVINEVQVLPASIENYDILICMYICTVIMILRCLYTAYKIFQRYFKKKYSQVPIRLNEV